MHFLIGLYLLHRLCGAPIRLNVIGRVCLWAIVGVVVLAGLAKGGTP